MNEAVSICNFTEKTLHLGLSRYRAFKLFSRIRQPRPGCTVITGDALLDRASCIRVVDDARQKHACGVS